MKTRTVIIDPADKEKIQFYKKAANEYARNLPGWAKEYLYTKPFCKFEEELNTTPVNYFHDLANIIKALNLPGKSRILDVACGPGWLCEFLYRFGYDVTGVDISTDLLQIAKERIENLKFSPANWDKTHIQFIPLDLESNYLKVQFDGIIFYDCLHHFINEEQIIKNATRMLARGGKILIKEGAMPPAGSEAERNLFRETDEYNTLESPFDHHYLVDLLNKNGIKYIKEYVEINGFFEKNESNLSEIRKLFEEPYQVNFLIGQREVIESEPPNISAYWSAAIQLKEIQQKVRGSIIDIKIKLKILNNGECTWKRGANLDAGTVAVGFKLFDKDETLIDEHTGRTTIPHNLLPGESCELSIFYPLDTSTEATESTIKIDMVLQGYFWFEHKNTKPLILIASREQDHWSIRQAR
jgi:2-polyprenyl-3-methyl-5-hydroxy-6-metoxy-1,4-benzoquinol methylase